MGKKLIIILVLILFIIAGSAFALLFLNQEPEKPKVEKPELPVTNNTIGNIEIKQEYLTYILIELGAYKLHNSPFQNNKPRIKFDVEGEIFTSEVENNKINTIKGNFGEEDIKFITTKIAVVNAINSDNIAESFKNSIETEESSFEIRTDKKTLFLKGYLGLYKELTGEEISITGSFFEIFKG